MGMGEATGESRMGAAEGSAWVNGGQPANTVDALMPGPQAGMSSLTPRWAVIGARMDPEALLLTEERDSLALDCPGKGSGETRERFLNRPRVLGNSANRGEMSFA